jgi:hypothetical protein
VNWLLRVVVSGLLGIFGTFGVAVGIYWMGIFAGWSEGMAGGAALFAAIGATILAVTAVISIAGNDSYTQLKGKVEAAEKLYKSSQFDVVRLKEELRVEKLKKEAYR